MESGFRICPFCQSPTPLDEERCPECRRSLAGLPLKVHHVPSRSPEAAPAVEPAADWTPTPPGGTLLGSSDRRTGRSRRAAEPRSRSHRMPLALAGSLLMAIALGWIAVRAIDHDPKDMATADAAPVATASIAATLPAAPRIRATAPPAAVPTPAATSEPTMVTPATAPTPTPTPTRVVVHPRVSEPAIPETGAEYERLRRARRAALELAEGRRDALLRRVERLEDQLALIEDPDAQAQMQATLDEAQAQLEAADKEVARLRRELGE